MADNWLGMFEIEKNHILLDGYVLNAAIRISTNKKVFPKIISNLKVSKSTDWLTRLSRLIL